MPKRTLLKALLIYSWYLSIAVFLIRVIVISITTNFNEVLLIIFISLPVIPIVFLLNALVCLLIFKLFRNMNALAPITVSVVAYVIAPIGINYLLMYVDGVSDFGYAYKVLFMPSNDMLITDVIPYFTSVPVTIWYSVKARLFEI